MSAEDTPSNPVNPPPKATTDVPSNPSLETTDKKPVIANSPSAESSIEPIMDDKQAATLLASIKAHQIPTTFCTSIERSTINDEHKTQKDGSPNATSSKPTDTKPSNDSNPRKRTHSQMESDSTATHIPTSKSETSPLCDPRTKKRQAIIRIIPKQTPLPSDPFKDTDWNTTPFIFIRLTYFNKRKCSRFPLRIDSYSLFTAFIEYYFQSLTHCTWHAECDENWIECLDDWNAIRDEYLSTHPLRPFFLELMIINDSLPMKRVYAPKAVYVDNPYKCKYPPTKSDIKPPVQPSMASNPPVQPSFHPPPSAPYPPTQPHAAPVPYYPPPTQPPVHPVAYTQPQMAPPMAPPMAPIGADNGGYHHVTYPHYLSARSASSSASSLRSESSRSNMSSRNGHKRSNVITGGAIVPDPTTYLPFAHAGQSTPQMRTLHKIVWALQHQTKPLTIDVIRQCLPGKKKAQVNEIDYLLSSYQSYGYTKCVMLNSRKVWSLAPDAFPDEFWNTQWRRPN
eukprot:86019_1